MTDQDETLPPTEPRCGSCHWYERQPMEIKQGKCLRYPPQATNHIARGQPLSLCCRPTVNNIDRACGEYKYKRQVADGES